MIGCKKQDIDFCDSKRLFSQIWVLVMLLVKNK